MSIFDSWLGVRNRLLASPGFQRWASIFPLTRPIAQKRARELFDIVAGFVYSQILFACVRLKLFEILSEGPQTTETLAKRMDLPPEGAIRLLRAAVSLRLVALCGDKRYTLGELGAAMMGNPGIAAMVEHHSMVYADLADPVALLRGETKRTELSSYWSYAANADAASVDAQSIDGYTALMSDSQSLVAGDVLDAYSLKNHRCLLDVGGGDGTFLVTAAKRWPHLKVILFDLPAVAERARARFEREGLADRATAVGGDMMRDPLPEGADVVSLVRVLHDHNDAEALEIIKAARRVLPTGGTLLVAEPMSGTPGAEPIGDAYFGLYLLAMGSGRPRTPVEIENMLRVNVFDPVRLAPTARPILTRLLVATRMA
ncbi:Demethylspheroidene O-methyltransferase [Thiocapsa sp. KS1]|nr:methyltransferase [Thiocapsa sp. KS1]CRI65619.1 Demethylspheroidene O-methyltransferase [Thiocapsa sp. KS1]